MSRKTKIGLKLFLLFFFSIQLKLTLFGGFLWPFSSHRLFSQMPAMQKTIVQAVVTDANGNRQTVHPGRVIPIEYSRCSGLVRNIFIDGTEKQKRYLHRYLQKRINERPWIPFDEMFASVRSCENLTFVHSEVDFSSYVYPEPLPTRITEVLYP